MAIEKAYHMFNKFSRLSNNWYKLPDNLFAWYKIDELEGSVFKNTITTSYYPDLTVEGTLHWEEKFFHFLVGNWGHGLLGGYRYTTFPITMTCFSNQDGINSIDNQMEMGIYSDADPGSPNPVMGLGTRTYSPSFQKKFYSGPTYCDMPFDFRNQWLFNAIRCRYTPDSKGQYLYIKPSGILTLAIDGTCKYNAFNAVQSVFVSGKESLGSCFRGFIADVMIWCGSYLSDDELTNLYKFLKGRYSL